MTKRSDNLSPQGTQTKAAFILINILTLIFYVVESLQALTHSAEFTPSWKN